MSVKYNLSPTEILKLLGYTEPAAKDELELFEKENNLKLPTLLFDFLNLARNNPLFSTADIWATDDTFADFSYQYIEEGIEDCREDFEDDHTSCEENVFYPFSKLPKDQWSELVANYLQIGSDYGAGVLSYGIEEKDLMQENPPVSYIFYEDDSLTEWKLIFPKLSDYLMGVLLDVLVCVNYNTAQEVLRKKGWSFCENKYANEKEIKEELSLKKIDMSMMPNHQSCYDTDSFYRCCFDDEKKVFYVVINDISLMLIKAE